MKIGLYGNLDRVKKKDVIDDFAAFLRQNGYNPRLFDQIDDAEVDVLIVLGGDGTILHIAETLAKKSIPVIGINYGTLGFLAEFEKEDDARVLELLRIIEKGEAHLLEHSMIELQIGEKRYYALNEVSIQRDYTDLQSQMMETTVKINGERMINFKGDGAIVCTPTGSTAYSLSAGGAILDPRASVFMLTPLCSFSLHARPIVFCEKDTLTIDVAYSSSFVLVDGKVVHRFCGEESLIVRKSTYSLILPTMNANGFYDKVEKKLK